MTTKTPGVLCVISTPRTEDVTTEDFEFECKEASKSRRVFLEGAGISMVSHEHYISAEPHKQPQRCMDLYELDDIEPLLSGKAILAEGGDGPLIAHSYTYKHFSSHGVTAGHSSDKPADLVFVSFDPPLSHLDEMNKWYEEEHIPLLSKVPGWMSSVRGKMVLQSEESDPHLPKYGAFHRYSAGSGLGTSPEFKHATSTPWREEIIGVITKEGKKSRSQWVFKQT